MSNEPKTLRSQDARTARLAEIHAPHMQALTGFVETLRQQKGVDYQIPFFDPFDGGINARALFLLEAPGPQAKGSGFVSRDNPDETAKNLWTMTRDAGLDRTDCILWNVCPWFVGTEAKIRAVRASEVREASEALRWLVERLGRLECVALVGRKAQLARATIEQTRPDVRIVEMPHPSPMFVNRTPGNRSLVLQGFQAVRAILS
jgi:uracil-DNA glycosylase